MAKHAELPKWWRGGPTRSTEVCIGMQLLTFKPIINVGPVPEQASLVASVAMVIAVGQCQCHHVMGGQHASRWSE